MKPKVPALIGGIFVLMLVIVVGGFLLINRRGPVDVENAEETSKVEINRDGFEPDTIKVKAGTTVTWTNKDSRAHHVASDPHPIHTDEPGLESENLSKGETFSYTFTEKGEYTYHCHIHPTEKGAVVVE